MFVCLVFYLAAGNRDGKSNIRSCFNHEEYKRPYHQLVPFYLRNGYFSIIFLLDEFGLFHRGVNNVNLIKVEFAQDFFNVSKLEQLDYLLFSMV